MVLIDSFVTPLFSLICHSWSTPWHVFDFRPYDAHVMLLAHAWESIFIHGDLPGDLRGNYVKIKWTDAWCTSVSLHELTFLRQAATPLLINILSTFYDNCRPSNVKRSDDSLAVHIRDLIHQFHLMWLRNGCNNYTLMKIFRGRT